MNKVMNGIKKTFNDFLKTDFKKLFSFISIFYLNVFINLFIIYLIIYIGLKYEIVERRKEIDRLYKEGICNYEDPCEYPY